MLPAKNRAPRSLFAELRAKDRNVKRLESADFDILFKKDGSPAKAGVVISKRIAKKAVLRNRIKRTVNEAIREELGQLGGQVLIIVKRDISGLKVARVKEKIFGVFEKLND